MGNHTTEPERASRPSRTSLADLGFPSLVLVYADGGSRRISRRPLPPDGVVLGRDLVVFDGGALGDPKMSRRHAEVRHDGQRFVLRDLGARNGSWLNGERIDGDAALHSGDVIRVGDVFLVFAPSAEPGEADSTIVGTSASMIAVQRSIGLVARHGHAVLVVGDTGTGKELVARSLHRRSERAGRFVAVNCAALSEGVLESELFGHVRGAFTGAQQEQEGLFRAADGGTLLLDELGDMSLALQAKLLRAAETGRIRPVGASREVAVDVRLIGATHRDMAAMVADGRFRADLYARLTQWTVALPPLRERRDDILLVARHLLDELGAGARTIGLELAQALLLHDWPLNVRGLRNVLSTAVLASPADTMLSMGHEVEAVLASYAAIASTAQTAGRSEGPPAEVALREALANAKGSVAEAARRLGKSRQQVYRWAETLGIDLERFRSRP